MLQAVVLVVSLASAALVHGQDQGSYGPSDSGSPFPDCGPGGNCSDPASNAQPVTARRMVSNCTDEGKRYEFIREGKHIANITVPANTRSQPFSAPEGLYDIRIYNAGGYLRTFNYTMSATSTGIHSGCAEESLRVNPAHGIKQAGRIVNNCGHDVRLAFWRGARAPQKSQKVYEVSVPRRSSVSKVLLSGSYTVATSSGNDSFAVKAQQPWTYEPACVSSHRPPNRHWEGDRHR